MMMMSSLRRATRELFVFVVLSEENQTKMSGSTNHLLLRPIRYTFLLLHYLHFIDPRIKTRVVRRLFLSDCIFVFFCDRHV